MPTETIAAIAAACTTPKLTPVVFPCIPNDFTSTVAGNLHYTTRFRGDILLLSNFVSLDVSEGEG